MVAFWAVVRKELRLLSSDPATFVLLFIMPFVLVAVLSTALEPLVTGRPELTVSVIDLDDSEASQQLVTRLDATDGLAVTSLDWSEADATDDHIYDLFGDGERFSALVIPAGYAEGGRQTLALFGDPARASYVEAVREQLTAIVAVDELAELLVSVVIEETGATAAEARESVSRAALSAGEAAGDELRTVVVSERDTFPSAFEQTVPGFAVMFGLFVAFALAINLSLEKEETKTWARTLAAPISQPALVLARVGVYALLGVAQLLLMLVLGWAIWGMELGSAPIALVLTIVCWSFVAAAFGTLVASLLNNTAAIAATISISVIVFGAFGGALIPIAFLPDWMQPLARATPQFWAVDAIQELIVRGRGFGDVLPQLGVLLAFAAAFLAIALRPRTAVE